MLCLVCGFGLAEPRLGGLPATSLACYPEAFLGPWLPVEHQPRATHWGGVMIEALFVVVIFFMGLGSACWLLNKEIKQLWNHIFEINTQLLQIRQAHTQIMDRLERLQHPPTLTILKGGGNEPVIVTPPKPGTPYPQGVKR